MNLGQSFAEECRKQRAFSTCSLSIYYPFTTHLLVIYYPFTGHNGASMQWIPHVFAWFSHQKHPVLPPKECMFRRFRRRKIYGFQLFFSAVCQYISLYTAPAAASSGQKTCVPRGGNRAMGARQRQGVPGAWRRHRDGLAEC